VHTEDAVVMVATGRATIDTVLFPDAVLHPVLFVTVTLSVTDPDLVAVYVMLLVPAPAVIHPFVMLHA
jgi:hypothetical protein